MFPDPCEPPGFGGYWAAAYRMGHTIIALGVESLVPPPFFSLLYTPIHYPIPVPSPIHLTDVPGLIRADPLGWLWYNIMTHN